MAKEQFREWNPNGTIKVKYTDNRGNTQIWVADQARLLESTQQIIEEFQRQRIKLTNRQTYYQLVSHNIIPNADKIYKRICTFLTDARYGGVSLEDGEWFEVIPLALNMEQIRQYNPPPNPAKITDPRAAWYIEEFGRSSWELDALRPEVLRGIVERGIQVQMDVDKYNAWIAREKPLKQKLQDFADSLVNEESKEGEE